MKKILFVVLLFLCFTSIQALSAAVAPPDFVTVEFDECYNTDYTNVHIDVLVPKPTDFTEDYNESYTEMYVWFANYDFLIGADRVSYRAFIYDDYYHSECQAVVPLSTSDYDFYEVIVFNADGTVYARDAITATELEDLNEDGLYPVYGFNLDTEALEMYTTEPNANMGGWGIFAAVIYVILGLAFIVSVGIIGLIGNKTFKDCVQDEYRKPYLYIHWTIQPIMVVFAIIGMFAVYGFLQEFLILLGLLLIETMEYMILRFSIKKEEHNITNKELRKLFIFTLFYALFIWITMSGFVM